MTRGAWSENMEILPREDAENSHPLQGYIRLSHTKLLITSHLKDHLSEKHLLLALVCVDVYCCFWELYKFCFHTHRKPCKRNFVTHLILSKKEESVQKERDWM